jgi:uncharacterized membrane protein
LHHQLFNVEGALARALPGCAIDSAYPRDAATPLEHLSDYGTLALIDYPLPSLMQRLAIANWVRGGGHLLVCGGQYTLAQANWGKTFLEDVLPASLQEAPDVVKLPAAAVLGPAPTATFAGNPGVYYAQKVTPRPQARVLWWAGRRPILLQCAVGKGRSTLCTATVLGEAEKGGTPFWLWKGYSAALAAAIK